MVPVVGDLVEDLIAYGNQGWEPWGLVPRAAVGVNAGTVVGLRRQVFKVETAQSDPRRTRWEVLAVSIFGDLKPQLDECGASGWTPWCVLPNVPGAPKGVLMGLKRPKSMIETRRTLNDGVIKFNRDKP